MWVSEARQQPITTPLPSQDLGQSATMIIFSLLPMNYVGFTSPLFNSIGYVHHEVFHRLANEDFVR
jgi:hypothetical protein